MTTGVFALMLWLVGCTNRVDCEDPQTVLVAGEQPLTCADTQVVVEWTEILAARRAPRQRPLIHGAVQARYRADPAGTRAWLKEIRKERDTLTGLEQFDAAAIRAEAVYRMSKGTGLVTSDDGTLWTAVEEAITVWGSHDEDRLALTESDIEGWILYGSLCREVQGGTTLRISVADRLDVYRIIKERWDTGSRAERVALTAMGPFWPSVKQRWQQASYDEQQAWIKAAPLPPPMEATSLGYLSVILEGDVVGHVAGLHTEFGPLQMGH